MNTGMQSSGCTPAGSWTSTTPVGASMKGKPADAKNMAVIMMMHNSQYVATASLAFMEDYYYKLDKAMEASKTGFAYLHVYAPCPTGWRFPTAETIDVCRKGVQSNFVNLWEYESDAGLTFTHPVDDPLPLNEYLESIGKFRHLNEEQTNHLQGRIDHQVNQLKDFCKSA